MNQAIDKLEELTQRLAAFAPDSFARKRLERTVINWLANILNDDETGELSQAIVDEWNIVNTHSPIHILHDPD